MTSPNFRTGFTKRSKSPVTSFLYPIHLLKVGMEIDFISGERGIKTILPFIRDVFLQELMTTKFEMSKME